MRTSSARSVGLLVLALVCAACSAPRGSAVEGGVLDVSWRATTVNVDGSPLNEVVSYRVYYDTTDPPCPNGPFVVVEGLGARPRVTITGLTIGQLYYVAVAAQTSHGSSGCSATVSSRARRR